MTPLGTWVAVRAAMWRGQQLLCLPGDQGWDLPGGYLRDGDRDPLQALQRELGDQLGWSPPQPAQLLAAGRADAGGSQPQCLYLLYQLPRPESQQLPSGAQWLEPGPAREQLGESCPELLRLLLAAWPQPKLVRDRIPELIREQGEATPVRQIGGVQLLQALATKLGEEVNELQAELHHPQRLREEAADVQEVLAALLERAGVDPQQLQATQQRKREQRGGFQAGWVLGEP